jgi:hypothetical protein
MSTLDTLIEAQDANRKEITALRGDFKTFMDQLELNRLGMMEMFKEMQNGGDAAVPVAGGTEDNRAKRESGPGLFSGIAGLLSGSFLGKLAKAGLFAGLGSIIYDQFAKEFGLDDTKTLALKIGGSIGNFMTSLIGDALGSIPLLGDLLPKDKDGNVDITGRQAALGVAGVAGATSLAASAIKGTPGAVAGRYGDFKDRSKAFDENKEYRSKDGKKVLSGAARTKVQNKDRLAHEAAESEKTARREGRARERKANVKNALKRPGPAGVLALGASMAVDEIAAQMGVEEGSTADTVLDAGTAALNIGGMAATGAAIGSVIPGVGTLIGGGIGAAIGGGMELYDYFGSKKNAEATAGAVELQQKVSTQKMESESAPIIVMPPSPPTAQSSSGPIPMPATGGMTPTESSGSKVSNWHSTSFVSQ